MKNSLVYNPLILKMPVLNKTNKNIDNKKTNIKSPIDVIKIPKTNLNNNGQKINYGTNKPILVKIKTIKI